MSDFESDADGLVPSFIPSHFVAQIFSEAAKHKAPHLISGFCESERLVVMALKTKRGVVSWTLNWPHNRNGFNLISQEAALAYDQQTKIELRNADSEIFH